MNCGRICDQMLKSPLGEDSPSWDGSLNFMMIGNARMLLTAYHSL